MAAEVEMREAGGAGVGGGAGGGPAGSGIGGGGGGSSALTSARSLGEYIASLEEKQKVSTQTCLFTCRFLVFKFSR